MRICIKKMDLSRREKALQFGLLTADAALDEAVRARLRCVNLGVLASILETLVPGQVCTVLERLDFRLDFRLLTNFEIVLVGQCVFYMCHIFLARQNLLRHLVHGGLHGCRVIVGKCLEGNISRQLPGLVERADVRLDILEVAEFPPFPDRVYFRAHDPVPHLRERGILVADKSMECRSCALEDEQTLNAGANGQARVAVVVGVDVAGLSAVAEEAVRMRLAINIHASPAMSDYLDMHAVNVLVLGREVGRKDGCK